MILRQLAVVLLAIGGSISLAHANDLVIQVDVSENGTKIYATTVNAAFAQQTRLRVGSDEQYKGMAPVPFDAKLDGVKISVTPLDLKLPNSIGKEPVDGAVMLNTQVEVLKLISMKAVLPEIDQWRISETKYLRPGESQSLSSTVAGKVYEVRLTPKWVGEKPAI